MQVDGARHQEASLAGHFQRGGRVRDGADLFDDATADAHLLREIIGVLLEYPGKDRVNLEIRTGGRRVLMELPVVSTSYCEGLRQRLEALLGPNAVVLEGDAGPHVEDPPL